MRIGLAVYESLLRSLVAGIVDASRRATHSGCLTRASALHSSSAASWWISVRDFDPWPRHLLRASPVDRASALCGRRRWDL